MALSLDTKRHKQARTHASHRIARTHQTRAAQYKKDDNVSHSSRILEPVGPASTRLPFKRYAVTRIVLYRYAHTQGGGLFVVVARALSLAVKRGVLLSRRREG